MEERLKTRAQADARPRVAQTQEPYKYVPLGDGGFKRLAVSALVRRLETAPTEEDARDAALLINRLRAGDPNA